MAEAEVSEPSAGYAPPSPIFVVFLVVLTLGAAGWFVAEGLAATRSGPERLSRALLDVAPRTTAPIDFELERMDGETVRLADLRDKTVFLNFWATWCPPCVEEMPSLRRLYAAFEDDPRFAFLAVSTDASWSEVRTFFADDPAPFPVLLDPEGAVARQYGTTKFPETYVLQDGRIVGHIIGPRDWDRWFAEGWLREVLEGRASAR